MAHPNDARAIRAGFSQRRGEVAGDRRPESETVTLCAAFRSDPIVFLTLNASAAASLSPRTADGAGPFKTSLNVWSAPRGPVITTKTGKVTSAMDGHQKNNRAKRIVA
jgi:hypothetical protein